MGIGTTKEQEKSNRLKKARRSKHKAKNARKNRNRRGAGNCTKRKFYIDIHSYETYRIHWLLIFFAYSANAIDITYNELQLSMSVHLFFLDRFRSKSFTRST